MIDFISVPVIAGFTSAAAITIASSQVLVVMVKVVSIKVLLTQMVQRMVNDQKAFHLKPPALQVKGLLGVVIEHKSHLHLGAVNPWIDVFKYIHTYK